MGRSLEGPYTFLPGDLIGVGLQSPWLARKPVRAGSGESGLRKVFLAEDKVPEACDVRRICNDQIHGAGLQSEAKPRDCWLTDLVASCNAALRLAGRDTGAGLFLLVRRLAAEFDALVLRISRSRAVRSRMRRRSSFAAMLRMEKMISAKWDVVSR